MQPQLSSLEESLGRDGENQPPRPRILLRKNQLKSDRPRKKKLRTTSSRPRAEISIEIILPNVRLTETLYSTLLPETSEITGFRSSARITKDNKTLRLRVTADDIVALRAATNTFLRFVSVTMKTINTVLPFYTADKQAPTQPTTGK